ncbi:MAG: hypothetical protein ACOC0U_07705 [Desulfovibrionales bacterium]
MNRLSEVSLSELTRTMQKLELLYRNAPDTYEEILEEICEQYRLARELVTAIERISEEGAEQEMIHKLDLNMKYLVALWVLDKNLELPDISSNEDPFTIQ